MSAPPNLPPGWRFYPTDEELITYYLKKKILSPTCSNVAIMTEINLSKFNPWELPGIALFGESEWYFFTPRDRKYPNGARPNRAAASGYWKATGTDRPILSSYGSRCIGVKKALVFYKGRPPKGAKTDWMMYEYRLLDESSRSTRVRGSMRLDDWVLCRIRQKSNTMISTKDIRDNKRIRAFPRLNLAHGDNNFIENGKSYKSENYELGFQDSDLVKQTSFLFQDDTSVDNMFDVHYGIESPTTGSINAALEGIKRVLSIEALDEQESEISSDKIPFSYDHASNLNEPSIFEISLD